MSMQTLLVANRGEIARRVFRTCRRLGITTVAVHTALDTDALHVRDADVAVLVGSYLDADDILAAARSTGADAIHPGYGFLSENSSFARAVVDAGITWVGPTPEVIEQMGRKDAAREIAVVAGVPVVPAYDLDDDPSGFAYPVLAKAAAGGGGKGMRVVHSAAELPEALAAARREAASAFGDDTMIIEKFVERGRHIEVQLLGDRYGTVLHFGTRECSVQRRHQKVIEEAPADLDEELRERIHAAAVRLGEAVGYTNAGTVEFLLDAETDDFYFLEMNTRLQVEHPVTEIVNGVDLVELQLAVTGAAALGAAEVDDEVATGSRHAMEARIYAEDAFGGFLPQAGRAARVEWPEQARVDHALESGQVVSTSYDPMLGKVIVEGADREEARRNLVAALDDTAILGLTTNTGFLRVLAASDDFRDNQIDTAWLDRHELPAPDPVPARRLAAWEVFRTRREDEGPFRSDGFRLGAAPARVVIELDEPVTLDGPAPHDRPVADVRSDRVEIVHQGQRFVFQRPDVFGDQAADLGDGAISSPMPGTVLDVRVADGDRVEAGQVLVVLEAMKMELSLKAPFDGTVSGLAASTGAQVALGATLLQVEADHDDE